MYRTKTNLIRLRNEITDYVQMRSEEFNLSSETAEDIVSQAYLHAHARMNRVKVRKDANMAIRSLAWSEVDNALNALNTPFERILSEAVRLDQPTEDGDTIEVADDSEFEPCAEEIPEWKIMTRRQIDQLRGIERRLATQLKSPTMSYAKARRNVGLTRHEFYKIIKKFKIRFSQCFQAYNECLAAEFAARFQFPLVYMSRDSEDDLHEPATTTKGVPNEQV